MNLSTTEIGTTEIKWCPWIAAAEIVLIFLLFVLHAGWVPPDVNEAHYLAKAKHHWNSAWCPGDAFLDSADTHLVFYRTFGWLTLYLSLPAVAWVGRILTWGLMAWAWQRVSVALTAGPLYSVLAAGLFLCFSYRFHMAGEWVVGGVEAKGFAYVLVLLGLEAIVRGRWRRVWPLLGVASSFHVLVGGWSVVAAGTAWLLMRTDRHPLVSMLPAVGGGLLLALPGLIPAIALNISVDADLVRQANEIYVFLRLPHHLVLHRLPLGMILRYLGLLAAWLTLCRVSPAEPGDRRLRWFVAGSLAITAAGAIIDLATLNHRAIAAALLRFYWLRLSDVLLPVGMALTAASFIARQSRSRPSVGRWWLSAAVLLATLSMGENVYRRWRQGAPPADVRSRLADHDDWRRACQWIAENTSSDARFLTPQWQTTFKWYAGRSEVATFKDLPQDAGGIVQWHERIQAIYARPADRQRGPWHDSIVELPPERLIDLARKTNYDFQYILIDRTRGAAHLPFEQIYPATPEENRSYAVFRLLGTPNDNGSSDRERVPAGRPR